MRWFLLVILFCYKANAIDEFSLPDAKKQIDDGVRIKDIVSFEGIRDNLLMGYGLVVGLSGTGDNLRNSAFTKQELEDFLSRAGINSKGANIRTKNIAAVTVTATLPAFIKNGKRVDVMVSALGDATNLTGGVLLVTPLLGADGEVYAVAQGEISLSSIEPKPRSNAVNKGVKTSGFIVGGAIIEKEIDFSLDNMEVINLSLNNPDISTATYIADIINERIYSGIAKAGNPSNVAMRIPESYRDNVMGLLTKVEQLQIKPDNSAKIIIDESLGTVVMGSDIRINKVAISHGNLSVNIADNVTELETGASLYDLVNGLNALGVSMRDLISILRQVKNIGALQGEIIVK
ncbi:MAG: flagellar basal body P-ring protein FlgI [Rickettsiaceae bacterium H1]|nr:flagellar basal body P-ring protein FlgI [Rickettsiaceae bacterium H1]